MFYPFLTNLFLLSIFVINQPPFYLLYRSFFASRLAGILWENFLVSERLKKQSYSHLFSSNYFWRTWDKKEIDWIEEREGKLFGYEFRWGKGKVKIPVDWKNTYKNSHFTVITPDNYLEFVT